MKKVYLVYASLFYEDGSHNLLLLHVFASAVKAEVYANYQRISIERKGADGVFGHGVDFAVIRLDCESICTIDWSDDLKYLQDEKL